MAADNEWYHVDSAVWSVAVGISFREVCRVIVVVSAEYSHVIAAEEWLRVATRVFWGSAWSEPTVELCVRVAAVKCCVSGHGVVAASVA